MAIFGIAVNGDSVDHVEGFASAEGGNAAYANGDGCSRLSGVLGYRHTGGSPLENLVYAGLGDLSDLF